MKVISGCVTINPFTAAACEISGLKDAPDAAANSIFSGPVTHLLSVLCVLLKILSDAGAKKKTKSCKTSNSLNFIGRFQVTSRQ